MSAAPLLSPQWFRVAALRPRLAGQLRVERMPYRGEVWHVLVGAEERRSFRLNAAAYAFVGRCDGMRSVQRLWDLLLAELKDDAPTQDDLLQLLAQLHAAALVDFDRRPDFGPAAAPPAPVRDPGAAPSNSLLSFRIPLGQPERWLTWLSPHCRWLFTPTALLVWAAIVLAGTLAAVLNAGTLAAHARTWMDTPRMLMLAWLAYPVVKALHELAHGLAVRQWGGKVPEWGLTMLMFVPVPYVDASAASAFAQRSRRLVVSGAGIMVELLLASIALAIALNAEAGWVRDLSFVVFFIGAVSTLLVNGNPLLRFDGYHLLCDALELPNLASRSARHWIELLRARLLRAPAERGIVAAPGERAWLWAYAPLALLYRLAISLAIVAWLGALSFVLGGAMALYFGWMLVGKPLWILWKFLHGTVLGEADRARALRRAGVAAALLVALAALVPLPFSSIVQGVVWLPEQALVRAETDGFVGSLQVADGEPVHAGQTLLRLEAPALAADRVRLEGRVTALETERFQALRADASRSVSIERELDFTVAELQRVNERAAQLDVVAQVEGTVVISRAEDLPGRFVKQGDLLGHVLTGEPTIVRVAIPQEQAALVQARSRAVGVQLVEARGAAWPAELLREVPGTTPRLPSAALGDRGGGSIVTDPKDEQGLTPAEGVVLADVRLPANVTTRIGARAWVRFDHGFAPLAEQAARRLQQLFLKHFNPAE